MDAKERRKKYEKLTFLDDYMMRRMFYLGKEKLFEKIVSIVLDRDDVSIRRVETEKHMIGNTRTVVLDAFGEDKEGRVYDIEIQHYKEKDVGLRVRVYGDMIDMSYFQEGMDYSRMPTRYIIFICDRDPFITQRPRAMRRFRINDDDDVLLGDRTVTYFVNCAYQGDAKKELQYLIHDMNCVNFSDLKIPEIKNIMKSLKSEKEEYMAYTNVMKDSLEEGREIGIAMGIEEGRKAGRAEGMSIGVLQQKKATALNMIKEGFSDQIIAKMTDLSEEEVIAIRHQVK